MTEDDPTLAVSRDLRAIIELSGHLRDQALHRAAHRELPGGDATVMLGPVSSPEAWENRVETIERLWWESDDPTRPLIGIDEDANWEPPLQTLLFWSEAARNETGCVFEPEPHIPRPTIETEADWLRDNLRWVYDNEVKWDDFERDIRQARARLEAVLYAGEREERSKVPCLYCCEDSTGAVITISLVKRYGSKVEGDYWLCPKCRREYSRDAYAKAQENHLGSVPAERYVPLPVAVAAIPRPPTTVRSWLYRTQVEVDPFTGEQRVIERGKVKWACNVKTRGIEAWWPHVRDEHRDRLEREARKRAS